MFFHIFIWQLNITTENKTKQLTSFLIYLLKNTDLPSILPAVRKINCSTLAVKGTENLSGLSKLSDGLHTINYQGVLKSPSNTSSITAQDNSVLS